PGEGTRPGASRAVRSPDAVARRAAPPDGERTATGDRGRSLRDPLPADRPTGRRAPRGDGGPPPMEAPGPRAAPAGRLHPRGGGDGAHRSARELGDAG